MQQNNFNDIRVDTGKKIKKIFGNKIRSMEFYDVVEEAGHWSFKIGFFAYDYFYIVFTYEKGFEILMYIPTLINLNGFQTLLF